MIGDAVSPSPAIKAPMNRCGHRAKRGKMKQCTFMQPAWAYPNNGPFGKMIP